MEFITYQNFNKSITENFDHNFIINKRGLYAVSITASCRSGKQTSQRGGEDLRIEIDGKKLREIPAKDKPQYKDILTTWNGTDLKGLKKTVIFILWLEKGNHKITFAPYRKAKIENIKIDFVKDTSKIEFSLEKQAEDGDRRPWHAFALINLPLKFLSANITTKWRLKDSDDVKLIIDNKIQKNKFSIFHRNWLWSGSIFKKFFQKETQEKNIKTDLSQGIHYIEFWADRMPVLHNVELDFGEAIKIKRIPTKDDPEWTGNFYDDTEQIILSRAIFGEARSLSDKGKAAVGWTIKNRVEDLSRWSNNYHDVILEKKQYSVFNETDKNLPFVKNPFQDKTQIDEWFKCYEIAGKVMQGEIKDLTNGANHYFSNFIPTPDWAKSKQSEFKIQIGNTLFYNLDWSKNKGFIKLKPLLIGLISIAVLLTGVYVIAEIGDVNNNIIISDVAKNMPSGKRFLLNPITEEIEVIYFDKNGAFLRSAQMTTNGYSKSHFKASYSGDGDRLGFFQELHKKGEGYDKNDEKSRKEYYDNYIALMIMDGKHGALKEVYRGDAHTSYWEWGRDDYGHVIVYYNCGSSCLYAYKINIETKEIESEYHVY